ncbi:hypothetical protein MUK42_37372 [Musa troglodytarum]|uniref:NAC domain-containing protein n=1 Tax=Musa troglodytarum TaxID=320322 RepID=A0A9E7HCB3_9LILI|nr:hypothetical protein MUK42_37372 [Musa troglodytarum]
MTSPTLTLYSRLSSAPFSSSSSLVSSPEPENSAVHGARRPRPERLQVPSHGGGTRGRLPRQLGRRRTLPARAVAFADVYGTEPWNLLGSGRQEGFFFAERKPKSSGGSRVDRKAGTGSWALNKKQEAVKSIVGGREMVVGRKSYLSFNDGRRKNSGWCMYEYEMISSGFQRRVLCHVKKNSHTAVSGGGTTTKTVDSSIFTEAVSAVSGGSCVGQKRNREESSTLSAVSVTEAISGGTTINGGTLEEAMLGSSVAHSSTALQLDVSPPPTAGVPPGSPSSTHVGGDQLGITTEELEAFLASSSSSVDVGGEQNCTGGDAFFTTEVEASPFDLLDRCPAWNRSGLS